MLAEMVFDCKQIFGLVIAFIFVVSFVVHLILYRLAVKKNRKTGKFLGEYYSYAMIVSFIFIIVMVALVLSSAYDEGMKQSAAQDLRDQGFCVIKAEPEDKAGTATLCRNDGSPQQVDIFKQDDRWIVVASPPAAADSTAPQPLRPEDFDTTTTSQPLR